MINIEPVRWSCILPLELIFLGILLFFLIIQILSTDCLHWLFYIIQIPTCFFNLLIWCYCILRQWDNNIGWHGFSAWYSLPCWLYNQFKPLIMPPKSKALLERGQQIYTKNATAQVLALIQIRDGYRTR